MFFNCARWHQGEVNPFKNEILLKKANIKYLACISHTKEFAFFQKKKPVRFIALRRVIPVVCVTNEREEKVVEQHN